MADLFDNPMGLMGFKFVEFASPTSNVVDPIFRGGPGWQRVRRRQDRRPRRGRSGWWGLRVWRPGPNPTAAQR